MNSIVKQLKQFKADAIYEKKKHYNAAERKRRYYRILSFTPLYNFFIKKSYRTF